MKVVVIGGTGHIGSFLVPRLVAAGHEVTCMTRGASAPYAVSGIWKEVQRLRIDRTSEEASGGFGSRVAGLSPDVVMDLICFTRESAQHIVTSLEGKTGMYLCCGTIWVHGPSVTVPTTEAQPRKPFGEYGVHKAEMEEWLIMHHRSTGFPVSILHPGHIVGPGWAPVNPAGNFNPAVFETLAGGRRLALPNFGLETVHHVHADDVAQAFMKAMEHWSVAVGESFHVVSPSAMTLRGYAQRIAQWFGKEADLEFLSWEKWRAGVSAEDAAATLDHISHSPCCSTEKARRLLGYQPRYESLEAVCESLRWLIDNRKISAGKPAG